MSSLCLQKQKGFTIVELLIVIVVIGILAAITIVAFNGVQKRAGDTKRIDDVALIGKALTMWSINNSKTFEEMNAGYNGNSATGWYSAAYAGQAVNTVLIASGFLNDGVKEPAKSGSRDYMLTRCGDASDNRRVVFARLDDTPTQTVAQQIQSSNCTDAYINSFVSSYGMNYARVVSGS
jgi:prepilin-type N-terminal cleavage/methylation domain-containing protein